MGSIGAKLNYSLPYTIYIIYIMEDETSTCPFSKNGQKNGQVSCQFAYLS
jgi:hypothetical protein